MNDNFANWVVVGLLVGGGIGYFLSGVALVFFDDEIFNWIDGSRDYVRRKMGLK